MLGAVLCTTGCGGATEDGAVPATYDIVLAGGRVVDPESGLDAIRNIGIIAGRIEAVSEVPLNGSTVIDAGDLVAAPGFVNVHSRSWTPLGQHFEVRDGVTTALELEGGAYPVTACGTFEPIAITYEDVEWAAPLRRNRRPWPEESALPSLQLSCPLTKTYSIPADATFGRSKVARSAMVSGSNTTISA